MTPFMWRSLIEPALQDPSTVYIVDPTSVGGSRVGSPADVIARTVVIAPPNSDHYKDFKKRRPSPLSLYLEHWTLEELLAARPYISPDVTEQEVVERWLQQGGNPRVVLRTADSFMKAVNRTATRLGVMPLDTLRRVPQVELDRACLPPVRLDTVARAA